MRRILPLLLVALALPTAAAATYGDSISVGVYVFDNGTATVGDAYLKRGERTETVPDGEFGVALLNAENETLEELRFDATFSVSGSGGHLSGNGSATRRVLRTVWLPYTRDAAWVQVLHFDGGRTVQDHVALPSLVCRTGDGTCPAYCDGRRVDRDCTCGDGTCQTALDEEEFCPQDCQEPATDGPGDGTDEEPAPDGDSGIDVVGLLPYLFGGLIAAFLLYLLVSRVEVQ